VRGQEAACLGGRAPGDHRERNAGGGKVAQQRSVGNEALRLLETDQAARGVALVQQLERGLEKK
jgi:hypothetical protein